MLGTKRLGQVQPPPVFTTRAGTDEPGAKCAVLGANAFREFIMKTTTKKNNAYHTLRKR